MSRERIFAVIEGGSENKASIIYDYFMMFTIALSLIPLAFKVRDINIAFFLIDKITVSVFIVDYILRLVTADLKLGKGKASFMMYPFTPLAVIDLLAILPSLALLSTTFWLLRLVRLLRMFRVFKAFKMFRYSRSIVVIMNVLKKQKAALLATGTFAVGYTIVAALLVFNVEPNSFNNFFEAFYWAVESLTTVGYGDIYPVSTAGRVVTMISSFVGIAVIALPSSVITAGYLEEIRSTDNGAQD